jgi:hypothetical protein
MKSADGLLNQVRLLVGSPLQWEINAKLPFFGNGTLIEEHGNCYRVPSDIAKIYQLLENSSLNSQEAIQALQHLVNSCNAKAPSQQLYSKIKQLLNGQSNPSIAHNSRP